MSEQTGIIIFVSIMLGTFPAALFLYGVGMMICMIFEWRAALGEGKKDEMDN